MSDAIRQAAMAAAQSLPNQQQQAQAAAQTAPAPAAAPAPAPVPQAVQYAPPTALYQATVDGKKIDVPVAEMAAKYQMGTAAEKRLQQANALLGEHRQAIETQQRLATLARTNPAAFAEEAHKAFGLRHAAQAENSNSARIDPDEAPETTALRQEIAQLRAQYQDLDQFRGHVVMQNMAAVVRGSIQQFPLYQRNAAAAQRAESVVATILANNPGVTPADAVGMVHAQDAEFLQTELQATRDQRANAVQQFASVPPGSGTPQLSHADIPKMTPEQMRGKSLTAVKGIAEQIKRAAGLG